MLTKVVHFGAIPIIPIVIVIAARHHDRYRCSWYDYDQHPCSVVIAATAAAAAAVVGRHRRQDYLMLCIEELRVESANFLAQLLLLREAVCLHTTH